MALLSEIEPIEAVLRRPHGLLEGPRFGAAGSVIYSDVLAGGVWECSAAGELRELLGRRRGIGGIVAHADGGWVLSGRDVVHLLPDGSQREVLGAEGVHGYNDLGARADGALLAGALRFRPFQGEQPVPGQLLAIEPGGAVTVLNEDVLWPNGIAVSADGSLIYISDYAAGAVLAVPAGGGPAEEFARVPEGSPDGLAIDQGGAVWVALGGAGAIARFLADGELDQVLELPAGFISSLSFGGPDMCDVLITTADNQVLPELGGTILHARSEIPGAPLAPIRV